MDSSKQPQYLTGHLTSLNSIRHNQLHITHGSAFYNFDVYGTDKWKNNWLDIALDHKIIDTSWDRYSLDDLFWKLQYPFVASCHLQHVPIWKVDTLYQSHTHNVLPMNLFLVMETSVYWHNSQQLRNHPTMILRLVQENNNHYLNHCIK